MKKLKNITFLLLFTFLIQSCGTENKPTYKLNIGVNPSDSGTIQLEPSGGIYEEGQEVVLTPIPNDGLIFEDWSGDISSTSNPLSLIIDSDKEIVGHFGKTGIYLHPNGVTIMCQNAPIGYKQFIDEIEYEVVDSELLSQRIREGVDLTKLCTSKITNMGGLFSGNGLRSRSSFNQPIGNWDVSNVTNMFAMFRFNDSFNQPIGNWDVSNVTNMAEMFRFSYFNQPIGEWNTKNLTRMEEMFEGSIFNQPIGKWDISNVTSLYKLFLRSSFNQPIGNWDVSNVTNMELLFWETPFNQDLSNWDVSNVTNMRGLFLQTPFNYSIENWDVSNVINMSAMFTSSSFNQSLNNWDVSNVTDMSFMFQRSSFNQSIDSWDVSSVNNMSYMFRSSSFNQSLKNWDVSNVTSMDLMFAVYPVQSDNPPSSFNQTEISDWDVSNVTSMQGMFYYSSEFNQDLSNWCVSYFSIKPEDFDVNTLSWVLPKPSWGTCPSN